MTRLSMLSLDDDDYEALGFRKQTDAESGEIVVAMVDGEAAVKRFRRDDGKVRLESSNPAFGPILTDRADIVGKVMLCIHRV